MDKTTFSTSLLSHEMLTGQCKDDTNQWPDLSERIKSQKPKQPSISDISAKSASKLSIARPIASRYDHTQDSRTRQQILDDRKLRKIEQKKEREQQKVEHQLEKIRGPKGEKIKLVNQQDAEKINQAISSNNEPFNRAKSRRSRNTANSLANFLDDNLSASTSTRSAYYNTAEHTTTTKAIDERLHSKGKTREVPKPKHNSQLKKNILESREIRKELHCGENSTEHSVDKGSNDGNEEITLDVQKQCDTPDEHNEPAFSRKYRPYCTNAITKELCDITESLLRDIFRFQDKAYNQNQIKARAHKRFVVGFKETQRQLEIKKIKLLIIAPDLEPTSTADFGGDFYCYIFLKFCFHEF